MSERVVKPSISLPESLWEFVEQEKKLAGHGMASRVIQEALKLLRSRREKQAAYKSKIRAALRKRTSAKKYEAAK